MLCYVYVRNAVCRILDFRYTCVCNTYNCVHIYMYIYINMYAQVVTDKYTFTDRHVCGASVFASFANFFTCCYATCSPWELWTGASLAQESRIRLISKSDSQATDVFKTALFWPLSTKVQGAFPYSYHLGVLGLAIALLLSAGFPLRCAAAVMARKAMILLQWEDHFLI